MKDKWLHCDNIFKLVFVGHPNPRCPRYFLCQPDKFIDAWEVKTQCKFLSNVKCTCREVSPLWQLAMATTLGQTTEMRPIKVHCLGQIAIILLMKHLCGIQMCTGFTPNPVLQLNMALPIYFLWAFGFSCFCHSCHPKNADSCGISLSDTIVMCFVQVW